MSRLARYAVLLIVSAGAVFAQPAPITVRVPVDCWSSPGACKINSSRAGGLTDDYQYLSTFSQSSCSTGFQLPFGSTVQSVTAEAYLFDASSSDPASLVTLYLNGAPLGAPLSVTNSRSSGCHGYATSQRYDFASGSFPSGFTGYNVRGPNTVSVGTGAQQAAVEIVDLAITYLPPRSFDFNIDEFTSKSDRTILISKQRLNDAYTSLLQNGDREVSIVVRANGPTGPVANQTFYFRVRDPQSDPLDAPYAYDRGPNDNKDSSGGTLSGTNVTPISSQIPTVSAISGADGYVRMTLTITDHAAGDNYQIEASADPNFTCPNGCDMSGVITAWKRVYVETDRMFRRGAYLTADIAPCQTTPCFVPLSDVRGIGRGDTLRLIHAPRSNVVGPQLSYSEDVQVVRIDRRNDRVEVTTYQQSYFGPDSTVGSGPLDYLADAVGVITGNDADDFFTPNTQSIPLLFAGTFVEHVFVQDDPVPAIPFEDQLLGDASLLTSEATAIARKWFFNLDRPNHEHLLSARRALNAGLQGLTTARINTNWSWIFVQTVIDSSPRRGGGEWTFNGEVTAHEMAHQWQVNPSPAVGGHCSLFRWNSPTLYCSMHGDYGVAAQPCQQTCPEFYDGQVGFHYQSAIDSEYVTIRRRPDPVPQVP